MRNSLRASLAGRSPALREEYDEAWGYGRVRTRIGGRQTLAAAVEHDALGLAMVSWPVGLILARYYAGRDAARADDLAKRFTELAAAESDMNRLARYRGDVEGVAATIAKTCAPETAARLAEVVSDRFLIDPKITTALEPATPRPKPGA